MKYEATVGEIPVKLLAKPPTPQEIGDLVSRWTLPQIAEFFSALGEGIKNRSPVGAMLARSRLIGASIRSHEEEYCDGSASSLIEGLACGLTLASREDA